jgi:DNA-binding beta-propeller fold protein YncE
MAWLLLNSTAAVAVTTLVGSGASGYADGAGSVASFKRIAGVSISSDSTFLLAADAPNHRVRRIVIATGVVTTLAGSGSAAYVDATGISASFNSPTSVAVSPDGSFALVSDNINHCIRRVQIATGVVTTLAGSTTGCKGGSNSNIDGTGPSAAFCNPNGVAISPDGTFALVADANTYRVRRIVIATRVVTTLAGNQVIGSADGTGESASFNGPHGVAISPDGSFALVGDTNNLLVRRVVIATGVVTTLAGSGTFASVDGIGNLASFFNTQDVFISPDGAFALVTEGARVRRVVIATGAVITLAGSGASTFANGLGTSASFSGSNGISISRDGTFALVGDSYLVRHIALSAPCNAGYYCPAGSSSATQHLCSAGYYCAAGSSAPAICGAGYYCLSGSTASTGSGICDAGYYCPAGSSSATQMLCLAGFFCLSSNGSFNARGAVDGQGMGLYCF